MPSSTAAKLTLDEFHEPLHDVIMRVELELEAIARSIEENQSLIARSTWAVGSADPAYLTAMQEADLISQKIDGIAKFLRTMADAVPADFHVETHRATGSLRLDELIRKIGANGRSHKHSETVDSGHIDLF